MEPYRFFLQLEIAVYVKFNINRNWYLVPVQMYSCFKNVTLLSKTKQFEYKVIDNFHFFILQFHLLSEAFIIEGWLYYLAAERDFLLFV